MICRICNKNLDLSEFYEYMLQHNDYVCKRCHSERNKQRRKQLKEENPDLYKQKNRETQKRWKLKHPIYAWAHNTLGKHKQSGFIINITKKELVEFAKQNKYCRYCGKLLEYKPYTDMKLSERPSLDRIDNEKELNKNNIQLVCHACNTMKGQLSHKEFIVKCKLILEKENGS